MYLAEKMAALVALLTEAEEERVLRIFYEKISISKVWTKME